MHLHDKPSGTIAHLAYVGEPTEITFPDATVIGVSREPGETTRRNPPPPADDAGRFTFPKPGTFGLIVNTRAGERKEVFVAVYHGSVRDHAQLAGTVTNRGASLAPMLLSIARAHGRELAATTPDRPLPPNVRPADHGCDHPGVLVGVVANGRRA